MISDENIRDFARLSDDEIRKRLTDAASTGKLSSDKLKKALQDPEDIRKVLSKVSASDVERLLRLFGRENAERMAEKLKGGK